MSRREQQRQETRRKVFEAALVVFRRDGVADSRIEDITDAPPAAAAGKPSNVPRAQVQRPGVGSHTLRPPFAVTATPVALRSGGAHPVRARRRFWWRDVGMRGGSLS